MGANNKVVQSSSAVGKAWTLRGTMRPFDTESSGPERPQSFDCTCFVQAAYTPPRGNSHDKLPVYLTLLPVTGISKSTDLLLNSRRSSCTPCHSVDEMECPICWEPLQSKAAVSAPCGHLFHEPCLERYVRQKVQEGFPSPDCPTCRAPIKQLTKENLRRIPLHLRGHVHGAIRRVYLASPEDADGDRCRELDHLWSRLEDMHNSLQENKEKRTAAEERAEGLAKALKQAQAKNKELQNELASLSSQQQSMSQPTKESIWGQDELSNHSRSNRELSAEQELQKWLDAALQPNIFQGSMHEREINQANAIAPYMSQAFTSGFHPGMLPVPQRPVPSSTYAYPQFFPMIPIVPPMSPGRFVAPPGSPLSNTRTQQPVPSSGEMHRPRSRGRALVGTARDRRVADIRYQHAHALLPGHRRNAAAAQGHAQHALAPPPFLQQPAMGATWIYPEGSA